MGANINNVVNVALIEGGELAARDNPNITVMMTSQQDGPISTARRYQIYSDANSVAIDFGSGSQVSSFANSFFGTQPNPTNTGGYLVVGYWRGATETVAAGSAVLRGAQLNETFVISTLQGIADGSFSIDIDGSTEDLTLLDFQSATSMSDVVAALNLQLVGGVASYEDQRIVIKSATTGALSTINYVEAGATGTYIGSTLQLVSGTGSSVTQGTAADSLAPETKVEAMAQLKAIAGFRGAMFIEAPSDSEAKDLAEWGQANSVLQYDVFDQPAQLAISAANVVWDIKLSGLTNYRMLYSKAGNRKMAASYMARVHTVNFNAENSALTMQLKELSVAAEEYTQSEITAAKAVGLDIYTTIKLTPALLTSGANEFVDNRYNLIAFEDALQTDMYNLLKLTGTKIPQTRRGVNQLLDQVEKTTRNFVRAGVFAPGAWSSPDYFGDFDTFSKSIENNGFYWIAGKLADQPQSDRELRKSPVLQGAVKLAGAIHSVDCIVNVNK